MPSNIAKAATSSPESRHRPRDQQIATLARAQHGVVSLGQLTELGLSARAARDRVAAGRLHRVHRAVFAVGHCGLTTEGTYAAAVLARGAGAGLSDESAAHHLDLLPGAATHPVHVTVPGRARRPTAAIRTHACASLEPGDIAIVDGIPTTTVARTIFDLAERRPRRQAERAIGRAEEVHRVDFAPVHDLLQRFPRRRASYVLRALLESNRPIARTRNELEEAFLAICRDHALPDPYVNMWITFPEGGGAEADFAFPKHRLIAETDSLTFHRTQRSMSHDMRRDQRLTLLGWEVIRFGWDQVFRTPATVARTLADLLRLTSSR